MTRAAAFFDLDRTLIDANSARLFLRAEYAQGRVGRVQIFRAAIHLALYHFAGVDIEAAIGRAALFYAGSAEAEVRERMRTWFDREIAGLLLPGAREALEAHRARGESRVLLTASSAWLAAPAALAWDLDDWIANTFEADEDGRLTGALARPICVGAGKVARAERWAAARGIELADSTFYTDSFTDLPMLERVGHPVVVHPDPRLARTARRRGWPVLDWKGMAPVD